MKRETFIQEIIIYSTITIFFSQFSFRFLFLFFQFFFKTHFMRAIRLAAKHSLTLQLLQNLSEFSARLE